MSRAHVIALAALSISTSAAATRLIEQPEGGYEAFLGDVALPTSTTDAVVLKPCSTCPSLSLHVTPQTSYRLRRTAVPLGDLARAAADLVASGKARRTAVYVFYDIESGAVNRLVIEPLDDQ
jgi:hypothetical protein